MQQQFENQLPDDQPTRWARPAGAGAPGATPPPLDLAGTDADRAPSKPAPAHPPGGVVSHTPGRRDRLIDALAKVLDHLSGWHLEWAVSVVEETRERGRDAGGKGRIG